MGWSGLPTQAHIAHVRIAPNLVLAPMEGVTHPLMRQLMAEQGGLGLVCTEFVRISDQRQSRRHLKKAVVKVPGLPLSVQVMGKERERLQEAAILMQEIGAEIIDLNLGCPSPKAARGGVGAATENDGASVVAATSVVNVRMSSDASGGGGGGSLSWWLTTCLLVLGWRPRRTGCSRPRLAGGRG